MQQRLPLRTKYVYERGMTNKTELTLATKAGIRQLKLFPHRGHGVRVQGGRWEAPN